MSAGNGVTWLAFDIGCLECGEDSGILGIYDHKKEAEAACARAKKRQRDRWHGQHSMEVFALDSRSQFADPS